jgi:hypothetical protein
MLASCYCYGYWWWWWWWWEWNMGVIKRGFRKKKQMLPAPGGGVVSSTIWRCGNILGEGNVGVNWSKS